jgi:hypothetical protein
MKSSINQPPKQGPLFRKNVASNYTTTVVLDLATVEVWRTIPRTFRSPAIRLFLNGLKALIDKHGIEKASSFKLVVDE